MFKVIIKHIYIIVVAIFVVMVGNILAEKYGPSISNKISGFTHSADKEVQDVQRTVKDWNKNILD